MIAIPLLFIDILVGLLVGYLGQHMGYSLAATIGMSVAILTCVNFLFCFLVYQLTDKEN